MIRGLVLLTLTIFTVAIRCELYQINSHSYCFVVKNKQFSWEFCHSFRRTVVISKHLLHVYFHSVRVNFLISIIRWYFHIFCNCKFNKWFSQRFILFCKHLSKVRVWSQVKKYNVAYHILPMIYSKDLRSFNQD